MSGAISAGAYSAGVFDFLVEALDEWEKARAAPGYDGPPGRAVIAALVGASAGAIAAGIGTVALADTPVPLLAKDGSVRCRLRQLYDAWVVKPEFVSKDGPPDLLSLEDIEAGGAPVSVLNAGVLDAISGDALKIATPMAPRPFVSATLHVYMTLTDLRGTPYSIDFSASDGYHMLSHASRAHFKVGGLGTWQEESVFACDDPGVQLQAQDLPTGIASDLACDASDVGLRAQDPGTCFGGWGGLRLAALASAAFPFGLAPIELTAVYGAVKFPAGAPRGGPPGLVETAFDKAVFPDGTSFETKAVDGGVIDNDPFEYARFTLMEDPPNPNDRCGHTATRAVVMIAPFPEAPPLIAEGEPPSALASIARSLLATLRQQVRFKPDQLLAVRDEGVFSRFMVAPSRVPPHDEASLERPEKFTIATGLLGGFGGFMARSFRDHDYQLGRRNGQQFLRTGFLLPATRSYFEGWTPEAQAAARAPVPRQERDADGKLEDRFTPMLPIVPLYGTAAEEVPYPVWSRVSPEEVDTLLGRIATRLRAVAKATIANNGLTNRMAWLWQAGLALGEGRIAEYLRWSITADLVERDQIDGFDIPDAVVEGLALPLTLLASLKLSATPDPERGLVRAVLSRLASPDYTYRSVRGIARSLTDDQREDEAMPAVARVLERLAGRPQDQGAAVWQVPWIRDEPVYALARRRPKGFAALLRGRAPDALFSAPAMDRPSPKPAAPIPAALPRERPPL